MENFNSYKGNLSDESLNEVSVYFDDILRNKDMIKEMFRTNILVYEDKIHSGNEKIANLKEELERINSEFLIVENKLKLKFAKNHDQFQKHDINFKLLDKTLSHYKQLVRDRESEIKKIEEQSIFAHQDYQNKKIKLDCVNVQIIEADFQLKNMHKKFDEKVVNNGDEFNKSTLTDSTKAYELYTHKNTDNIESDRLQYKSNYENNNQSSIRNSEKLKDSKIYGTIAMSNDKLRNTKCYII